MSVIFNEFHSQKPPQKLLQVLLACLILLRWRASPIDNDRRPGRGVKGVEPWLPEPGIGALPGRGLFERVGEAGASRGLEFYCFSFREAISVASKEKPPAKGLKGSKAIRC